MNIVSKKSVNRAIELLQSSETKHREEAAENERYRRVESHCRFSHARRKRRQQSTSFSKNLVLEELKAHVARRDWARARCLFPCLLRRTTDIEPLIWRYALLLSLYGNNDNVSNISQFLQTCLGSEPADAPAILRRWLNLSEKKS